MIKLGIIGWRGIVGKVLINRIKSSKIFNNCEIFLFSTNINLINKYIHYAYNVNLLSKMNIIISCQGSNYTKKIIFILKTNNWHGYWVDASSYLRMKSYAKLILDPINKNDLIINLKKYNFYSGVNCTISLCLLSFKNLIKYDLIDWIFSSSYQAVSGAGASLLSNLINETKLMSTLPYNFSIINKIIKKKLKSPILFNIIPWIDKKNNYGQTKEEWKSKAEAEKILNKCFLIDSNCVRVSSLRCHSQNFFFKTKKNISINSLYELLNYKNVIIIKNNMNESIYKLNPFYVKKKLNIFLGRIRRSFIEKNIYNIFSIGDQLIWGAAEPIKRFIEILLEYLI